MAVRFTSRIKQWSAKKTRELDVSMLDLMTTIHRDAGNLAPVDTGSLVDSGRIVRHGLGYYSVIFGGGQVPYARRRHYENSKNPGTLRYLQRAGDANSKNFKRYIKG
jgi:hypothetical protein